MKIDQVRRGNVVKLIVVRGGGLQRCCSGGLFSHALDDSVTLTALSVVASATDTASPRDSPSQPATGRRPQRRG